MLGVVIKTNMTCYLQEFHEDDADTSLKEIQEAVGGYFETEPSWLNKILIVCNEEGRMLDLPVNIGANGVSDVLYDTVGDVVLLKAGEEDFESVPGNLAEFCLRYLSKVVGYEILEART